MGLICTHYAITAHAIIEKVKLSQHLKLRLTDRNSEVVCRMRVHGRVYHPLSLA